MILLNGIEMEFKQNAHACHCESHYGGVRQSQSHSAREIAASSPAPGGDLLAMTG